MKPTHTEGQGAIRTSLTPQGVLHEVNGIVPDAEELVIVLRGDLAAILRVASGKRKPEFLNENAILEHLMDRAGATEAQKRKKPHEGALLGSQECLVAGA